MDKKIVSVGYGNVKKVEIGGILPLAFVGGPCAIENRDHALFMAEAIAEICEKLDIPWIYKSCYDKDCRSSPKSFHGVGIEEGLKILSMNSPTWFASANVRCANEIAMRFIFLLVF